MREFKPNFAKMLSLAAVCSLDNLLPLFKKLGLQRSLHVSDIFYSSYCERAHGKSRAKRHDHDTQLFRSIPTTTKISQPRSNENRSQNETRPRPSHIHKHVGRKTIWMSFLCHLLFCCSSHRFFFQAQKIFVSRRILFQV